jgi:hypothetical protein
MEVLKLTGKIGSDGHLNLDLPTDLPEGKVDIILVINSVPNGIEKRKYDFSDLVGKLSWHGNAVDTQRELRNEW